jgi:hypothetical protein
MIAEEQGRSVGEAKSTVTSSEFVRWLERFKERMNEPSREDYYIAALTMRVDLLCWIVSNLFNPKPSKYGKKESDFILKFKFEELVRAKPESDVTGDDTLGEYYFEEVEEKEEPWEVDPTKSREPTKAIVMAAVGLNPDGTPMAKVVTRKPPKKGPPTPPPPLPYKKKDEK